MALFKSVIGMLVLAVAASLQSMAEPVHVVLETEKGAIELRLDVDRAPLSAGSFLAHLDAGLYDGSGFYRTVHPENDNGNPKISVIQGGVLAGTEGLPPVAHETTEQTGILHKDGVVSLARGEVGTGGGAAFFICIGDQPSLDMGGGRAVSGDGQGFAAFGRVISGMEVVRAIHRSPPTSQSADAYLAGQILDPPVKILNAFRK